VIILDTNVLGALMRSVPDAAVVKWLDCQPAESVWITSITLFEACGDLKPPAHLVHEKERKRRRHDRATLAAGARLGRLRLPSSLL